LLFKNYPHQIPLHPPFLKGEVPLLGKEGLGEIFMLLCDGYRHGGFTCKMI